jgi:hypothetical protein
MHASRIVIGVVASDYQKRASSKAINTDIDIVLTTSYLMTVAAAELMKHYSLTHALHSFFRHKCERSSCALKS